MGRLFRSGQGVVGCEARPDHLLLAHVVPGRRPAIKRLQQVPYRDISAEQLRDIAKASRLRSQPWVWILPHDAYQLMLVDVPDVPEEEIRSALRWRVKDLISFPLEEAAVDTLMLPGEAFRGRSRMAFAAIARRAQTEPVESAFGRAGLRLASIDIADTALRTLSTYSSQHNANALLRVEADQSFLCASYQGDLCLNRSLSLRLSDLVSPDEEPHAPAAEGGIALDTDTDVRLDTLALELQRSFDYFETQLGLGSLQELRLLTETPLESSLFDFLAKRFSLQAAPLNLADHLDIPDTIDEAEVARFAVAIGGALQWLGGRK
ncbi:MAG: hypothetical protein LAT62_02575 [Natronospirillum sp.]|uniref:type IV pilus biogenesis protein PilM n=1 Tax=Natronospirillum sp. TaxID=2812955 RepID=UPI0025F8D33A|nr:hypothetical protein [Natronospirillum sp.]MCH8550793.1 hypothetical protein [Natronospirillum sp.]